MSNFLIYTRVCTEILSTFYKINLVITIIANIFWPILTIGNNYYCYNFVYCTKWTLLGCHCRASAKRLTVNATIGAYFLPSGNKTKYWLCLVVLESQDHNSQLFFTKINVSSISWNIAYIAVRRNLVPRQRFKK